MPIFYICRHGQTEYNADGKIQGWLDTPLTKDGIENAHISGHKLRNKAISTIYSSDLGRAFITAYVISRVIGYKDNIEITPDLREVEFGDLSGLKEAQVIDIYAHLNNTDSYTPPHGESMEHMQKRILDFLYGLAEEDKAGVNLLVTHDCVINAIYSEYAKLDFGQYNTKHTNPTGFVAKIEVMNNEIIDFEKVK